MSYLQKVTQETKTRFWVNNPTMADCDASIAEGAFACTTNPPTAPSCIRQRRSLSETL